MPDGAKIDGLSFVTTPLDVATGISKSLANNVVVAKVNNMLWDLTRPLETNSELVLLKFSDEDGKEVISIFF